MSYKVWTQSRPLEYRGRLQLQERAGHPYLPVERAFIPYITDIRVDGITYRWIFEYNADGDFFVLQLERENDILVSGEKIVYGNELFRAHWDERYPITPIVPLDLSGEETEAGWEQLGTTVFLYIPPPEENDNA